MIKAILFDIGNVLVPFDFKRGYARIAPLCKCAAEEIPPRIRATGLVPKFETGLVDAQVFVRELSAALGLEMSYDQFCQLWSSIFLAGTLIPEEFIASLRDRYRLLVLSNTNPIHFSMVRENYPVLDLFHKHVLSYEVGAAKPSAAIYEAAIAQAGCTAGECFFTDDIQVNIDAALALGMDAVRFQSAEQIERELQARGVLL